MQINFSSQLNYCYRKRMGAAQTHHSHIGERERVHSRQTALSCENYHSDCFRFAFKPSPLDSQLIMNQSSWEKEKGNDHSMYESSSHIIIPHLTAFWERKIVDDASNRKHRSFVFIQRLTARE